MSEKHPLPDRPAQHIPETWSRPPSLRSSDADAGQFIGWLQILLGCAGMIYFSSFFETSVERHIDGQVLRIENNGLLVRGLEGFIGSGLFFLSGVIVTSRK